MKKNPFTNYDKIKVSGNFNKGQFLAAKKYYKNHLNKVVKWYNDDKFLFGKSLVKFFIAPNDELIIHFY